jgi:hypothetical protein
MTIQPFLSSSLNLWLDLIENAVRLRNTKIRDLGPLKKSAERARKAMFPRIYQGLGRNPFMDLILAAEGLPRGDELRRTGIIDLACQCLATLISSELRHPHKDGLVELAGRDFAAFRNRANESVSHAAYVRDTPKPRADIHD